MLKRQACAKFQSQIFDESEVIQILKVVRWHFCQVYSKTGVHKSIHIFLIFDSEQRLCVLVRSASVEAVLTCTHNQC